MQDPTILAASLASSDQSHQAGLGEAAPVVFLVRGAEGESDFFQDVVPTTLWMIRRRKDPIRPAHEETAFILLRHATDRQESSQSNECEM